MRWRARRPSRELRALRARVLDELRLVEHRERPLAVEQFVGIARQQRVGGENEVGAHATSANRSARSGPVSTTARRCGTKPRDLGAPVGERRWSALPPVRARPSAPARVRSRRAPATVRSFLNPCRRRARRRSPARAAPRKPCDAAPLILAQRTGELRRRFAGRGFDRRIESACEGLQTLRTEPTSRGHRIEPGENPGARFRETQASLFGERVVVEEFD